jgi:hypothetical protein
VQLQAGSHTAYMCTLSWEGIGQFVAAALPIGIAIAVAYIAWQQYEINRRQYRLALFDKRLAIYTAAMARCSSIIRKGRSDLQENFDFSRETRDHEFLFGPEVGIFIDGIWDHANKLDALKALNPRQPDKETEMMKWFMKQLGEGRKIFLRYMNFTDSF